MSNIREIRDGQAHHDLTTNSPKAVIFFGNMGCGHCTKMIPVFNELSQRYPDIVFAHVETSNVQTEDLSGVPTFAFYKNGVAYDKVLGAREDELRQKIEDLSEHSSSLRSKSLGTLKPYNRYDNF